MTGPSSIVSGRGRVRREGEGGGDAFAARGGEGGGERNAPVDRTVSVDEAAEEADVRRERGGDESADDGVRERPDGVRDKAGEGEDLKRRKREKRERCRVLR